MTAAGWRRLVITALLMVGLGVLFAGPASAHNVLISSDPADGTTLTAAPSLVSFTFDQPVQNFDPVVSVTGPDGQHYQTGSAEINGNVVSSAVSIGPAGAYIAAYRVVSADGHPVTGEVHFTVPAGAAGSGVATTSPGSSTASAPATTAAAAAGANDSGLSAWIWIGLVIAAVIIAAAAVLLLRRPSKD